MATRVVAGDKDTVLPLELVQGVAGLIPGAELRVLRGVGHYSHFEAPEKYNQVVDDFLSGHLKPKIYLKANCFDTKCVTPHPH